MSGLLVLARDYFERMANPIYGFAVNDEYSHRFGEFLETEGFERTLREEITLLRNTETFTSNGWLWLLGWARSRRIPIDRALLVDLFERWASVPARCAVVDLATMDFERDLPRRPFIEGFPEPFVALLLERSVMLQHHTVGGEPVGRQSFRSTSRAEDLLVVLMQVGNSVSLAAATALLRHQWTGHEALFAFARALTSSVDPETRRVWSQRLGVVLATDEGEV